MAGGVARKADFNVGWEVYQKVTKEPVRNYIYDLDLHIVNARGEKLEPAPRPPEVLAEVELKNYAYE